jgi:hypothetical protein
MDIDIDLQSDPEVDDGRRQAHDLIGLTLVEGEAHNTEQLVRLIFRPLNEIGDHTDQIKLLIHALYQATWCAHELLGAAATSDVARGDTTIPEPGEELSAQCINAFREARRRMWQVHLGYGH